MFLTLDSIRNFVIFVFIIGGLIFLHELGHFLAAISLRVKVKEFGLGFPPRLLGTALDKTGKRRWFFGKAPEDLDPSSVIYSLNWIPLGGFVRPAGEDDPSVPDGLSASPKLTRLIVLVAGPMMNFLVGLIVFTIAYATGWPQSTNRLTIVSVVAGAPAAVAGTQPGDIILSANGEAVTVENNRLVEIINAHLGQSITLGVERNGQPLNLTVVPRTEWPKDQGPTGVTLGQETTFVTQPLPQAFVSSIRQIGVQIREIFMIPARLIEGQLRADDVRMVSIVGMAQINNAIVNTAVKDQTLFPILGFIANITVALALTNLLPLPALDGGRILFVLIEAVRGRRVDPLREGYVHVMGLLVLLALMAFMVINDILNPIVLR